MMSWHLPLKKNTPTKYTQTSDIQKRLEPGSSQNPLPFPFCPKSGECAPSTASPLEFSWTDWKLAPWLLLPPHPHPPTPSLSSSSAPSPFCSALSLISVV